METNRNEGSKMTYLVEYNGRTYMYEVLEAGSDRDAEPVATFTTNEAAEAWIGAQS